MLLFVLDIMHNKSFRVSSFVTVNKMGRGTVYAGPRKFS